MGRSAPFEVVGREAEVATLDAFSATPPASPAVLLLTGESGIGKTTLWRMAVDTARRRSYAVLEAAPSEAESSLPFAVLADLLDIHLADALPALPVPQRRALEIALLLRTDESGAADQLAVATAFLRVLRALFGQGPALLAMDDAQWLDPSSARVLTFAIRRIKRGPLLLMIAQRSPADAPAPLELARAPAGEALQRLHLGPLSLGALHRLLAERLGTAFSRPVLRRLHDTSRGNPFFALELARAYLSADAIDNERLPLPAELASLVEARLGNLPRRTQAALVAAAALSKPSLEWVGAASGADARQALEPARRAGVVEIIGDRMQFIHPLMASAAYARLGPAQRQRLHAKLAEVVGDPEERARHLALSADGPDEAVASAIEQAAAEAARRGAQDAAADLYRQARLLTPDSAATAMRRRGVLEAESALQSGDTPRARVRLEELLAATPVGRDRAEVLVALARVHFNGLDWQSSVGLLEEALLQAGNDRPLRAQIELHIAINLDLLRRNVAESLAHARAAVALAEELGIQPILAEALALEAKNEFLLGRGWPSALVERAMRLEPASTMLPADRWPSDYLATMRGWGDDLPGAIATLEDVEARAAERGDEVSLNWALARAVELKIYSGRWAEAVADIERGIEIAVQAGQTLNEAIFLGLRALLDAQRGRAGSARATGEMALRAAAPSGAAMARRIALAALGTLELSLGRWREADAYLAPLTAETRAAGVGEPGAMRFLPDAIEAMIGIGRLEDAEALLGFLERQAQATRRRSGLAAAGRCRGLLLAVRGETGGAVAALTMAMAQHEGVALPLERPRTLLVLGEVQRRAKQKRVARESLEQALELFRDLGASLWADRARAELARIGGRAPASGGLSPTERRVADLVTEGRSNKQVAAEMFVTPKTVDTLLSRIYGKLGVHSRTELAARLREGDSKL